MEQYVKIGRAIGKGITKELVNFACWILVAALLISYFTPTDETDTSWWTRSGLKIVTDKKTGCEYLVGQGGGVVRRENVPCTKPVGGDNVASR